MRIVSLVLGSMITAAEYTMARPDTTDRIMNLKVKKNIVTGLEILVFSSLFVYSILPLLGFIKFENSLLTLTKTDIVR